MTTKNITTKPIRLRTFIEAFDAWRAWTQLNLGFESLDDLEPEQLAELQKLEAELFDARDALEDL